MGRGLLLRVVVMTFAGENPEIDPVAFGKTLPMNDRLFFTQVSIGLLPIPVVLKGYSIERGITHNADELVILHQ